MTNWRIDESENVETYLEREDVLVGDTIEVMSNNQLGYKKYKVVLDNNGNKTLRILADWGNEIYEERDNEDDDVDDDATVVDNSLERITIDGNETTDTQELYGGKKSRKSRRSRKSRKSKRSRKSRRNRKSRKYVR